MANEFDAYSDFYTDVEYLLKEHQTNMKDIQDNNIQLNSIPAPVEYEIKGRSFWDNFILSDAEKKDIKSGFSQIIEMTEEFTETQVKLAEKRNDAAKTEVEKQRDNLNRQIELRNQGYAANVQFAEREYQRALKEQQKAEEQERKALRQQLAIQSVEQTSNLVTASAGLLAKAKGNPIVYLPLLALMWGTFLNAKVKAVQATKYANGGLFDVGGGSHASGNDTSLGVHGGRERRVQRGERVAVINDRASKKYGRYIDDLINNVNSMRIEKIAQSRNAIVLNMSTHKLEKGINTLVEQGREKVYQMNGKTVREYKNLKQTYV
jgi:hypothetical protein